MQFFIKNGRNQENCETYPQVHITEHRWNDYSYMTMCLISVQMAADTSLIKLGTVRVMRKGQKQGSWVFTDSPSMFQKLDSHYCSLSTDEKFYPKLLDLGKIFAKRFLISMRDAAFSQNIWTRFSDDPCFKTSLLRNTSTALEQHERLNYLFGGPTRSVRKFTYEVLFPNSINPHRVTFDFRRTSLLPHRIMLLVGRNGAGKTQLMAKLAIALTGITEKAGPLDAPSHETDNKSGEFDKRAASGKLSVPPSFFSVIAISFNAFDKFELPPMLENSKLRYTYCGIRRPDGGLANEDDIVIAITNAVDSMTAGSRKDLQKSIKNVLGVKYSDNDLLTNTPTLYSTLSAGQRIVVNILTHLIANLKPKALVLVDEPEIHLHPSLMTTLITEFQRLLRKFDAHSVIATHSPIVAQQIPSRSIRILARDIDGPRSYIPSIECFGESLGEISNVLFEAREFERDYTSTIDKLLKKFNGRAADVESLFVQGLGSNAKAYLWARSGDES